ncbi:hypothetical protein D3C87_2007500 [compost metagenome]
MCVLPPEPVFFIARPVQCARRLGGIIARESRVERVPVGASERVEFTQTTLALTPEATKLPTVWGVVNITSRDLHRL